MKKADGSAYEALTPFAPMVTRADRSIQASDEP
jgi:hypothetical protein